MTYYYGDIVTYYNEKRNVRFVGYFVEYGSIGRPLFRMLLDHRVGHETPLMGVEEDLTFYGHTVEVIGNMKSFGYLWDHENKRWYDQNEL